MMQRNSQSAIPGEQCTQCTQCSRHSWEFFFFFYSHHQYSTRWATVIISLCVIHTAAWSLRLARAIYAHCSGGYGCAVMTEWNIYACILMGAHARTHARTRPWWPMVMINTLLIQSLCPHPPRTDGTHIKKEWRRETKQGNAPYTKILSAHQLLRLDSRHFF